VSTKNELRFQLQTNTKQTNMNKIIRTLTVVAAFAALVLPLPALAGESPNLPVNGSFKALWEAKHTNEWAVFNASVEGGATRYFDTLSDALAALKKGDTLLARPPAEGFGFGERRLCREDEDAVLCLRARLAEALRRHDRRGLRDRSDEGRVT